MILYSCVMSCAEIGEGMILFRITKFIHRPTNYASERSALSMVHYACKEQIIDFDRCRCFSLEGIYKREEIEIHIYLFHGKVRLHRSLFFMRDELHNEENRNYRRSSLPGPACVSSSDNNEVNSSQRKTGVHSLMCSAPQIGTDV